MTTIFNENELHECASNVYKTPEEAISEALKYFELQVDEMQYLILTRQQNNCFEYCTSWDLPQKDGFRFSICQIF